MIDLAAPVRTVQGVTVFADHADPGLFHYLPVTPRLAVDAQQRPELSLLKYHLDPATRSVTGAALLELTVDLGVPDEVLAAVRSSVAAAVGRSALTLAPVWAESGTCRLLLLDSPPADAPVPADPPVDPAGRTAAADDPSGAAPPLVERVFGGATPDLASDATTMFACALDPDGSSIVEQALRHGGLPLGVVYALHTYGLRPALHATITADYAAAYRYYENRLHGGRLLLAADIGATTQDLVQHEAITVTVDDLVPDADRDGVYQHALDAVQQYVLTTLFTPTISQGQAPADTGTSAVSSLVGLFTISYSLVTIEATELKTLTYSLAVARSEEIVLAPQGMVSALLPAGVDVDRFIVMVDPAPPDQLSIDVACLIDLATEDIDHIDVTLTYAGADTALTLDAATPRRTQSLWYSAGAGTEVAVRYGVQLAAAGPRGLTGRVDSPASATSEHGLVRIDPRELYQRLDIRPTLQGVPADRYPRVLVDVEVHESMDGWTVTDTVTLDSSTPETQLSYRGRRDGLLTARYRARYLDPAGTVLTRPWRPCDPGPLVLGDPEPDVVSVTVLASARFGAVVSRLVVELRPDATPTAVTTMTFDATSTATTWSYAPGAAARGYTYRVTVQTVAGAVTSGSWRPGPDDSTLVVGEGFASLRTVQVVFVGDTLAAAGLLAAKIRLSNDTATGAVPGGVPADDERLVQDPLAPYTWTYPVADPAHEDYTMTVTRIHADGTSTDDTPRTGSDLLQVVAILAGS